MLRSSKKSRQHSTLIDTNFNVMKYYIKLERLAKLNKNVCKKITLIFILIDFYIKLCIGVLFIHLRIKQY